MQPRSVETYLSGRMEMFTAQLDATTEFRKRFSDPTALTA